uniref:NACHT and WD repeat domain containing 2 n=1 Tax=Salmo trutta TaxID=8032 RepID=A0A674F1N1_SALTR
MWPSGVGSRQPCLRESALRRAAISGNVLALPQHHVPTGRSVRVFICANPDDTEAERNALKEHVYPKLRDFCRENYGIEFQVVDLYWGMDPEEWDSPDLQHLRMKLLEECLQTSAGPCFVVGIIRILISLYKPSYNRPVHYTLLRIKFYCCCDVTL